MKILCITGMPTGDAAYAAQLLNQAGMEWPKLATNKKDRMDITEWHEHIASVVEDGMPRSSPLESPGKIWEQLASSFFIENITVPLWGWQDFRSAWLLDFWLHFENRICFLLVCVSPEHLVARMLEDKTSPELSPEAAINFWTAYHQTLLRFHHNNPTRSLMVDARELVSHPALITDLCNRCWNLSLSLPSDIIPFSLPSPLASYLGAQFCHDFSEAQRLQQELRASITHPEEGICDSLYDSEKIVADFRQLTARAAAGDQLTEAKATIARLTQDTEKLNARLVQMKKDKEDKEIHSSRAEQTSCEAVQEKELLLLQLHQIQEELEQVFLKNQEMQQELAKEQNRHQRLLRSYPEIYTYASLEAPDLTQGVGPLNWRIRQLDAGFRTFSLIELQSFLEGEAIMLAFQGGIEKPSPFLRWPAPGESTVKISSLKALSGDSTYSEMLKNLASDDWRLIRVLVHCLTQAGTFQQVHQRQTILQMWMNGLKQLTDDLESLACVLRYDRILLKEEEEVPHYACLWIRLEHISFGKKFWPEWEFRLSSADPAGGIDQNPRVEFPENYGQTPLTSWFEESENHNGSKLELRFAKPEAMDLDVWNRLAKEDQLLISALLERLPSMLTLLQTTFPTLSRPWEEWITVAKQLHTILQLRTAEPTSLEFSSMEQTRLPDPASLSEAPSSLIRLPKLDLNTSEHAQLVPTTSRKCSKRKRGNVPTPKLLCADNKKIFENVAKK